MHITNYLSPTIDSVVSTLQATGSIIIISTFNSDLGEFIVVTLQPFAPPEFGS